MQTISEIRALLDARGLRPQKRFGQNFLHDKNQLRKLVCAAGIKPGDVVLEVGPGTGTLTEALLESRVSVIACEVDPELAAIVDERFGDRITLIRGDCLQTKHKLHPDLVEAVYGIDFKLVANLPYQIASPLIAILLTEYPNCQSQFVTIQREVADRLLAVPETKAYGPLGIIVQALARVSLVAVLKPTSFWPVPEVTSAMVAILPERRLSPGETNEFAQFIHQLFHQRRKQLGAILGRDRDWPEGITADLRPEALSVERLMTLFRATSAEASEIASED